MNTEDLTGKMPSSLIKPLSIKFDRPIDEFSWIKKSLIFAELSQLSYAQPEEVKGIFKDAGLDHCVFIQNDGAEAYVLGNQFDCLIVCRGTEPHQWNDIEADANALTVAVDVGRVHSGFHEEVNQLWPLLEEQIAKNQRPVWFAGHSLGGAMAAVCAVRCKFSAILSTPYAIFSYGAPRVGNRPYTSVLNVKHYRWVNNNDIVPRVPPRWLGYRHMGQEIYLNRFGKISSLRSWLRVHDRVLGLIAALRLRKIDYFSDHSMEEYITHIRRYHEAELAGRSIQTPKHIAAE
ncbi:hypothetical protein [Undibacterium sp.]|uniref:lipase family protein n=1 Tax=Undibacterium sp. TaxID=1914977 RepID=UPI003752604D